MRARAFTRQLLRSRNFTRALRTLATETILVSRPTWTSMLRSVAFGTVAGGIGLGTLLWSAEEKGAVNYKQVEEDIRALISSAGSYDDGSYGPLFVRLAWHSAGNFSKYDHTGGTDGASMRFPPESGHGGNAGLQIARGLLESIKKKHPNISYADLYSLAGTVAIEALQGPRAKWRPGRSDHANEKSFAATPDGRLPDASQGARHVRDVFYRMGFSDQEIVALCGAHVLGRCHKDRSGYDGPWSRSPTMFSNDYFRLLLTEKWTPRQWTGPKQYEDASKTLMMLPADLALIEDPAFKHWVEAYAEDEDLFFRDFASAWTKLMEVGVEQFVSKSVWQKLF